MNCWRILEYNFKGSHPHKGDILFNICLMHQRVEKRVESIKSIKKSTAAYTITFGKIHSKVIRNKQKTQSLEQDLALLNNNSLDV